MKSPILKIVSATLVVFLVLMTVELLWWSNAASSYPKAFMTELPANQYVLPTLREKCGEPLEVASGEDAVLVRCGTLWPFRTVWAVSKPQFFEGAKP